jgi:hypothetical protein
MANRDLLKEAIADAKAVKEVAIANAKVALEEAFTPHLKTMLSQKIQEMDEINEEKEYMTKKEKEEGDDRTSDNKAEAETMKMRKIKEDEEVDLDEILSELELDEDARTDAEEEGYLDGMKDEKYDLSEESEAERADVDKYEYEKGKDAGEDDEIDLDDMSEDELKTMIEDVIGDMVDSGDLEAGGDPVELAGEDEEVEVDIDVVDDVDTEEVEIDEDKKQGYNARLDDAEGAKHGKKKQDMKQRRADSENMEKALGRRKFAGDSKMKEEMNKAKKELKEAYAAVRTLRSELQEVNLLNSKLLYTNKIFKAKNLTESQKIKVLKAFDKAETVKEAKRTYEVLNENLATKKTRSNLRENMGAASKAAGVAPKRRKSNILPEDAMVSRFKQLAGLK